MADRRMYDGKAQRAGDFKTIPAGWYRITSYVDSAVQALLVKTGNMEDGTRYAIVRFPVLEPTDAMKRAVSGEVVWGDPGSTDGDIPVMLIHPLDAGVHDEDGNYISRDRSFSCTQWLSKFGASLKGLVLSRSEGEVWDDIMWLLRNGTQHETLVNIWTNGWPSFSQALPDMEMLAVFAGFQHYDYRTGGPNWVLDQDTRKGKSDDEVRWRHKVPPLFRIIAPDIAVGTIVQYPWLNYMVVITEQEGTGPDDVVRTFGGGGSLAKFPPFCGTIGTDLPSLIMAHEDEALAILDDPDRKTDSYPPEILGWVEEAALEAAELGHILHLRTEEHGWMMFDQLNVASPPVIKRIAGREDFQVPFLISIEEQDRTVTVAEPIAREEIEITGHEAPLVQVMPAKDVVEAYNALAGMVGFESAVAYVKDDGRGAFAKNVGRQFALRALLPLFNFQPLGLDRQKAFHVTQEVYALLVGFCMTPEYLELAEQATGEEPFPGDLQARLTIAVADVRGEIVENDEAEGGF